jgi:metallophosphoesterase (TIGR03768 family)
MQIVKPNMKRKIIPIISASVLMWLPISGSGAALGTRQRTITPTLLTNVPGIFASDLALYATNGYSSWQWGPGSDGGQKWTTNMPAGYTGATNAARLLSFFCFSDIHLTDKETPSWPYWSAYKTQPGFTNQNSLAPGDTNFSLPPGDGNSSAYSPVMLYTTYVLDAAVRTANALHRLTPFDFGFSLGDDVNSAQYNELRWFIDIMDGQHITPSSGTNAGATTIDYQKPFQAAGLSPDIPWYQVLGNHDHFWAGSLVTTEYLRESYTNNQILLFGDLDTDGINSRSHFMGTVDGSTPYGSIIGVGPVAHFIDPVTGFTNAPMIALDTNRYYLETTNYMKEFFTTKSKPVGHGFSQWNVTNDLACYSFEPKANLPLKIIVLDDTMTDQNLDFAYGQGGLNTNQLNWLVGELEEGQAQEKLMIIAAHIPIELIGMEKSTNSVITSSNLLLTLHQYPNLILWVAGHMHRNNVKAQLSHYNDPEYDFWEVECPSLRDFPQEFRTFAILRNTDNTISIVTTDIDPEEAPGSCADKSRGYAVGAARIFAATGIAPTPNSVNPSNWDFTDTNSYTTNLEMIKLLTPVMREKIANCGEPLGHKVAIDRDGTGVTINFLGELQSADAPLDPWNNVATNSPYAVPAANGVKFYRAAE